MSRAPTGTQFHDRHVVRQPQGMRKVLGVPPACLVGGALLVQVQPTVRVGFALTPSIGLGGKGQDENIVVR